MKQGAMLDEQTPLSVEGLRVRLGAFQLHDLTFRLVPGQVTGFLGPNGAGKTTTLRLIMGMIRKDAGRVRMGALDHLKDEILFKRRIGFVPEENFFYSRMTVGEFLRFVAGFYEDWDDALCGRLARALDLPGFKRLGTLSKGTRMKVSLLAALSRSPSVFLLDEPTSGLDPRSRIEILKLVQETAHEQGRAVLFSTHSLHEVEQIGDRVIVIDKGCILADESLGELRRRIGRAWTLESYYLELVQ